MKHLLYRITHIESGKKYIGQYTGGEYFNRYWGSGLYIKRAIRKHGKSAFIKEIICECNTQEELDALEQQYIQEENTLVPFGYNLSPGGKGGDGGWSNKSEEEIKLWKEKLSRSAKERWQNPEMRAKYLSKIDRQQRAESARLSWSTGVMKSGGGYIRTPQILVKYSEAQKGKTLSESHKKKIGDALRGVKRPDETKRKLSKALKGRTFSKESLCKMSEAQKGKTDSIETRRKKSIAASGRSWIHKNNECKLVKKEEMLLFLEQGWLLGRITKPRIS